MSDYSQNDWRYYSESELEHSWGTSPEQKAAERRYNHEYWLRNRDRLIRQRASRAAGRDFEGELRNEQEARRHAESDRLHDNWNANRNADELRRGANEDTAKAEEYLQELEDSGNLVRFNNGGGMFRYDLNTLEGQIAAEKMDVAGKYANRSDERNQAATRTDAQAQRSSNQSIQQQNASRLRERTIQREYDNAVKAYSSTPVARIQNAAATAVEAGRQAVRAALDAVSNVAYSVVSRFKKK